MNADEFLSNHDLISERLYPGFKPPKTEIRKKILKRILGNITNAKVEYNNGEWMLKAGNVTVVGNFDKVAQECIRLAEGQ